MKDEDTNPVVTEWNLKKNIAYKSERRWSQIFATIEMIEEGLLR
jgi:hypothetical protein